MRDLREHFHVAGNPSQSSRQQCVLLLQLSVSHCFLSKIHRNQTFWVDYLPVLKWHWFGLPNGRSPAGASVTRLICQASLTECSTVGVRNVPWMFDHTQGHRSGKKHQFIRSRKIEFRQQLVSVAEYLTELLSWSCSYFPIMFSSKSQYFDIKAQILGQKLCYLYSGPHLQHYTHADVVYH